MEQEVLQRRNAVFNRIYYHSLILYKSCIPVPVRWLVECTVLFMALVFLLLWGYVHFTYIMSSEDCLTSITDRPFPRDVILRVEIYSNNSDIWYARQKALKALFHEVHVAHPGIEDDDISSILNSQWITEFCETNILVSLTGTNFFCNSLLTEIYDNDRDPLIESPSEYDSVENNVSDDSNEEEGYNVSVNTSALRYEFLENVSLRFDARDSDEEGSTSLENNTSTQEIEDMGGNYSAFLSKNHSLYELFNIYSLQFLALDYTVFEFSQEPGFLSITDSARAKLNISVVRLYVDPEQVTCFGGSFGQFLSKYFLGYDMMVISSFKGLLPPGHGSGYVKNLLTGSQYFYKVQWMGKWRYGAGLLPALFFTLVASVLLRQVHYHVFKFLTHFNHLLNQGIPMPIQTGAQIPFLIVTYATIGLVIVMSEALSDDSVFSLLMVGTVWEVDQFYSIYCKQETSKLYLPWFFFLYHFLPYAYYIRFNGQFWFIPFAFHWLLLQHAMLFFLHHCELPAIDRNQQENQIFHHPIQLHPDPPLEVLADPIVAEHEERNENAQREQMDSQQQGQESSENNSRTLTGAERLDENTELSLRTHLRGELPESSGDEGADLVPTQETTQHSELLYGESNDLAL